MQGLLIESCRSFQAGVSQTERLPASGHQLLHLAWHQHFNHPAQLHISIAPGLSASMAPAITAGAPAGIHEAATIEMHSMGVSTPYNGHRCRRHHRVGGLIQVPNGIIFSTGTKSIKFAASFPRTCTGSAAKQLTCPVPHQSGIATKLRCKPEDFPWRCLSARRWQRPQKRYGSRISAGQPITACQISGGRNTHRESMKSD